MRERISKLVCRLLHACARVLTQRIRIDQAWWGSE